MPRQADRLPRVAGLALAAAAFIALVLPVSVAAAQPDLRSAAFGDRGAGAHGGIVAAAPRPGDECDDPDAANAALCDDEGGGGGGGGGGSGMNVLVILGGALVAGVLLLILAFLYLRRQAGAPMVATEPGGDWWTCRNCGKANMVGTPRCYACGTWQG